MRRRLNREEFLVDLGFDRELLEPFTWPVFGRYELLDDQDNRHLFPEDLADIQDAVGFAGVALTGSSQAEKHPYLKASKDSNSMELYEPLIDVPHLFLEFARIGEREDRESLGDWIARYGLLGLHRLKPDERPRFERITDMYSRGGGPGETLLRIEEEAGKASDALIAWEAALSKDKEHLEEAVFGRQERTRLLEESRQASRKEFESQARISGIAYTDALLDVAVITTARIVQGAVEAFAYPSLELDVLQRPPDAPYGPELLRRTWKPRNLLGAMYLQFYWLITAGGHLTRCESESCGRIISLSRPDPRARKPPRHKRFCNDACRQAHHRSKKKT